MLTLLIIIWNCPGSAAIGHLLLSEHTYSHFAQVTPTALFLKHGKLGIQEQEYTQYSMKHFVTILLCTTRRRRERTQLENRMTFVTFVTNVTPKKSQGIGQSGSALASWAFDRHPVHHAKNIAAKVMVTSDNLGGYHNDYHPLVGVQYYQYYFFSINICCQWNR